MKFNEKLQQLRKTKNLSQEDLAAQVTVSRQAISKWELGESMPDVDNILQLSKLFNVSVDYLLNDEIEKNVERKEVNPSTEKSGSRFSVIISVGILAIGLVIAYVGWDQYQTVTPIGIGLCIQIVGCIVFEIISNTEKYKIQASKNRKLFYFISVWFILPLLIACIRNTLFMKVLISQIPYGFIFSFISTLVLVGFVLFFIIKGRK